MFQKRSFCPSTKLGRNEERDKNNRMRRKSRGKKRVSVISSRGLLKDEMRNRRWKSRITKCKNISSPLWTFYHSLETARFCFCGFVSPYDDHCKFFAANSGISRHTSGRASIGRPRGNQRPRAKSNYMAFLQLTPPL